ncbi:MAG TPA: hypothetical protein VGP58_02315 [Pyrinomonadaceae bacterium]|jgi:hypothetical protein|nr:hypothetical protein [Pyrinomonadaceae bacterium]
MINYELRITNYELRFAKILYFLCVFGCLIFSVKAQSINQSYPTPITSNEISGKIPARDLGDARLTTYYYTFDGIQGDVFINVVTTNFNGDIDVFTHDNLRPLTKITVYADASKNETGRVVYLRQPIKLILRIEGRTPNDDAATFQIKFAGSFAPAQAVAASSESETPEVKSNNQTDVRVNSVGTIIEIKPKPTPKEVIAKKSDKKTEPIAEVKTVEESDAEVEKVETKKTVEKKDEVSEIENPTEKTDTAKTQKENKTVVVVTDEIAEKEIVDESKKDLSGKARQTEEKAVEREESVVVKERKVSKKSKTVKSLPPNALENIRLIVLFKDGSKIERLMSEVLKVGVDKGILTIISKDGAIGRYSILDVAKMTIE